MPSGGLQFQRVAPDEEKGLADLTVAELRERASELEITGRSSMNKEELVQAVGDAEEQTARMNADNGSSSGDSEADASEDSGADERPWRESKSSSGDGEGEIDASHIPAPSIGPNTTIEHIPPQERLDMEKISDV